MPAVRRHGDAVPGHAALTRGLTVNPRPQAQVSCSRETSREHALPRASSSVVEAGFERASDVFVLAPACQGDENDSRARGCFLIWRATSYPSIFGRPMSSSTTSGQNPAAVWIASTPSKAVHVSWPDRRS